MKLPGTSAWLPALLAWRLRLQQRFRFAEEHVMLLWAAVAGVVGALMTVVFRDAIRALEQLVAGQSGSLVAIAGHLSSPMRIALPTVGGLLAGTLLLLERRVSSRATSDYMEAIAIGDGKISVASSLLRSLSSLLTIASGGSIGREGSMVQLAAMAASVTGRLKHFDPQRLRLLVACGAAAGLSAAYSAPIAAALFISEIVLGSISMVSLGPILVAAVVSNITMRQLPGYQPVYQMPAFPEIFGVEVFFFIVLGIACGLLSPLFLRLLRGAKTLFATRWLPVPLRLALGGLGVGAISLWEPGVWGNGYSVVNALLHAQWTWQAVLFLLLLKVLATAMTTGSGAVGGVFTPTLFVGAAIGYLAGLLVHGCCSGASSAPFAYAMVGMGAFLAAATSAPFMAILMISELTANDDVMVPLMLACVVAYFTARSLDASSMYEITVARIRQSRTALELRGARIATLTRPAQTVLRREADFAQLAKMFLAHPVKYVYVVDDDEAYQGAIALQDVAAALLGARPADDSSIAPFVHRDVLHELHPDMTLSEALDQFVQHSGERLPVVERADPARLLGVVYKSQLLAAYGKTDGTT